MRPLVKSGATALAGAVVFSALIFSNQAASTIRVISAAVRVPAVKATAGTRTLDRISVRSGTLSDSVTGSAFVPRGANYVRLATAESGIVYHSTFEPGLYNTSSAQGNLDYMKSSGYNTVRIFIDPGDGNIDHGIDTGALQSDGLSGDYLGNVADYVRRAAADGIYVIPVVSYFPFDSYYLNIVHGTDGGSIDTSAGGNNSFFLDLGFIKAKQAYMTNFVSDLESRLGADTTAILAYEVENEAFFETDKLPYSSTSGSFTGPDGLSYDMSSPSSRQQSADAGLVIQETFAANGVHAADSAALVTEGFFTNNAVGRSGFNGLPAGNSDPRVPGRPASVSIFGKVAFIDMHTYPTGTSYSVKTDLASSEYTLFAKPYIIGEFGASKSVYSNDITSAAYAMRDLQVNECSLGARGWLFWTWDSDTVTSLAGLNQGYSIVDSNGAINGVLAPIARRNACSP